MDRTGRLNDPRLPSTTRLPFTTCSALLARQGCSTPFTGSLPKLGSTEWVARTGDPRFGDVAVRRYDWDQTYSAADYRTLMLS